MFILNQVRRATAEEIAFAEQATAENATAMTVASVTSATLAGASAAGDSTPAASSTVDVAPATTTTVAVASAATATVDDRVTFHERWQSYMREKTVNPTVGCDLTPPPGTKCAECLKPILQGESWHTECISCRRPVHAHEACSTDDPKCRRCYTIDTCTAPRIPATLRPGSKEHGKHRNNKKAFLKQHLLHGDPSLQLSDWDLPKLYEALFSVKLHPEAKARRARSTQRARQRSVFVRHGATKSELWNESVAGHYDPLFRTTMKDSPANPVGVRADTWALEVEQTKKVLIKNMCDAGYPPTYVPYFCGDCLPNDDSSIPFAVISKKLTQKSCYLCSCRIMKTLPIPPTG